MDPLSCRPKQTHPSDLARVKLFLRQAHSPKASGETLKRHLDLDPLILLGLKFRHEGNLHSAIAGIGAEPHLISAAVSLDPRQQALRSAQVQFEITGPQGRKASVIVERQLSAELQDSFFRNLNLPFGKATHHAVINDAPSLGVHFLGRKLGHRLVFGHGWKRSETETSCRPNRPFNEKFHNPPTTHRSSGCQRKISPPNNLQNSNRLPFPFKDLRQARPRCEPKSASPVKERRFESCGVFAVD